MFRSAHTTKRPAPTQHPADTTAPNNNDKKRTDVVREVLVRPLGLAAVRGDELGEV